MAETGELTPIPDKSRRKYDCMVALELSEGKSKSLDEQLALVQPRQ